MAESRTALTWFDEKKIQEELLLISSLIMLNVVIIGGLTSTHFVHGLPSKSWFSSPN